MRRRQAKKIMRWTMVGMIVNLDEEPRELGYAIMSSYSDMQVEAAMRRLPETRESANWFNDNRRYKEEL